MKHYPDHHTLQDQHKRAVKALETLARLNIEARRIDFTAHPPVIEVYHCPGNRALAGQSTSGQGEADGKAYVNKQAAVQGCRVTWKEHP